MRSRSTFLTSSPLTRATTSVSWAGTGLAGAAAACSLRLKLMNRAGFRRLGAGEKRFAIDIRAVRRRELARVLVDVDEYDAFGNVEGLAGVARECARHELRPDRKRGLRAAQTDGLVVIQPDPHNRQQFGRKADEPGISKIVGGAGLSRGIQRKAVGAGGCGGALVQHAAHHVRDQERGVFSRDRLELRRLDWQILPRADDSRKTVKGMKRARLRKNRECRRNLERCRLEDTERDRWITLRLRADADTAPECGDVVEAYRLGDLDRGDVARMRESAAKRDRPVILVLVVGRRPDLVV